VPFSDLNEDDLVRILTEPKSAIVKQYQKLFALDNVDLEIQPQALRQIAKLAAERKTGARGLRSIIEGLLMKSQFDLHRLHKEGLSKIIITEDCVTQQMEPLRFYNISAEATG
jgi:ATP-dependent Clp protease ATP-binding subunit ClpX